MSNVVPNLNGPLAMPRHKTAKRRRACSSNRSNRALDLEEPLFELKLLLRAIKMIGEGMSADYDEQGEPIASVARAALQRLEAVEERWSEIIDGGDTRRAA